MSRISQTLTLLATLALASACAHTQRAPALSGPPAASPTAAPTTSQPQQKNFLSRTADATWNVVSAPVKLITPAKPAPAKTPETFDAPNIIIMTPMQDDTPATQP